MKASFPLCIFLLLLNASDLQAIELPAEPTMPQFKQAEITQTGIVFGLGIGLNYSYKDIEDPSNEGYINARPAEAHHGFGVSLSGSVGYRFSRFGLYFDQGFTIAPWFKKDDQSGELPPIPNSDQPSTLTQKRLQLRHKGFGEHLGSVLCYALSDEDDDLSKCDPDNDDEDDGDGHIALYSQSFLMVRTFLGSGSDFLSPALGVGYISTLFNKGEPKRSGPALKAELTLYQWFGLFFTYWHTDAANYYMGGLQIRLDLTMDDL